MIGCILLSAGESRRFGSPKALAAINGRPAIVCIQEALVQSSVDEVIIVLGANAEAVGLHALKHKKVRIVHNKDYKLGQTSSFQCGLREMAPGTVGIMVWPVDYPCVQASTVDALARAFRNSDRRRILVPVYEGRQGHPPVFPASLQEEFIRLLPDKEGLNTIQRRHTGIKVTYPVKDPGVVRTFNTREELDDIVRGQ